MANVTNPTPILNINDIDRAVQHGRALRSKAFTTMLRQAYKSLSTRFEDKKPTLDKDLRGCTSPA